MALPNTYNTNEPGQQNGAGDKAKLHLEEYTQILEGTIERRSALDGWIPFRKLINTSMATSFAVGASTLQKVDDEAVHLDGTKNDFSKNVVHVDTTIYARNIIPLLSVWQTEYDARKEIALEHGKAFAKFKDQALAIQAIQAGLATESAYSGGSAGKPKGHFGGTQVKLANPNDAEDPAQLFAAIARLIVGMQLKDVDPRHDDVIIGVRPDVFGTLLQCDQLVNEDWKSSEGNVVQNASILKQWGVPVVASNNFPNGEVISNHLLNSVNNSNFNGDFTDVVAFTISPRALLAVETIALTPDLFFDKLSKKWMVDAHTAYSAGHNRREFAGVILRK